MHKMKINIREVFTIKEKKICANIMASSDPWVTLGISQNEMIKKVNDPLLEVYIVENDKDIIGTFALQTKGAFNGYLKSIAIKKEWRGKQIGRIMMDFIEKRIFSLSSNVFLCVSSFNKKAQNFYQKLGYKKVGVITDYLVEGYDEILMRKTVGPIVTIAKNIN